MAPLTKAEIKKKIATIEGTLKMLKEQMNKMDEDETTSDDEDEEEEEKLCDKCTEEHGGIVELTFTQRLKKIALPLLFSLIGYSFMGTINDYYYPKK
ncbi:Hypothetical predicted protein [Cloeon dipterum]|uniref:Uncharacterized protein n=1 Tax=Cloeon dipterum TaxID=197152 RepID=A0A8S1DVQ9_9INSE|nr:Hypothetical predicted protein [Cloeon dipterum]